MKLAASVIQDIAHQFARLGHGHDSRKQHIDLNEFDAAPDIRGLCQGPPCRGKPILDLGPLCLWQRIDLIRQSLRFAADPIR
jgi:hypothetical protein